MERQNSAKNQYLATFLLNLLPLSYGFNSGWMSPSIPVLLATDSPLPSGPITSGDGSWIGAALCIGGIVGNIVSGWMADRYGRKVTAWLAAIPQIISWSLVIIADNVYYLIAMRLLAGFSGGVCYMVIPMFVAEIAEDRIRGMLSSVLVFSSNLGILVMYILGNYFSYEMIPRIVLVVPVMFLIGFSFIPETPYFFIKENDSNKSERSLKFFRGYSSGAQTVSKNFQLELESLQRAYNKGTHSENNDKLAWKDLTTRHARKAFLIGIGLMAFNQFSGTFAMLNYTATIFAESGSSLSANMSAIVIGSIQIVGSYCSTVLVERAGRKLLLTISGSGMAMGLTIFAGYSYVKSLGFNVDSFNWLPLACFAFTIFIASIGVLSMPFVILAEVMPLKIKGFAISFCMTISWFFAVIAVKYFSTLFDTLGMHGVLSLFAICSLSGTLFVAFTVPETKGKSFEAIAEMMG